MYLPCLLYTSLRERGLIDSTPGKGYYVTSLVTNVLLLLDQYTPFKEALYLSLIHIYTLYLYLCSYPAGDFRIIGRQLRTVYHSGNSDVFFKENRLV